MAPAVRAWGELTATWNLQPASSNTGVAATPSGGTTISFDVTAQVLAGATNGFLIRDSVEDQLFGVQAYSTRESAQDPTLVFTYGSHGHPRPVKDARSTAAAPAGRAGAAWPSGVVA